jgi:hypothetical protein
MTSRSDREGWESALDRWLAAGLVADETADAIRAWERGRLAGTPVNRLADAISYLGVSILLAGALMLIALISDGNDWSLALPFPLGAVAIGLTWLSVRSGLRALSDGFAGCSIVLITVGLGLWLDEVAGSGQESIGFLLLCLCVLLIGGWMIWLARSPIAAFLAAGALVLMPLSIAVEGAALDVGLYGSGVRTLADWALWSTFAAAVALGVGALLLLGRSRRWLEPDLAPWLRLGATLGAGAAILALAGASTEPVIDWMALLVGWIVTAWALRAGQIELLPASGLLLLGSLAGGLSDLDSGPRLGLVMVVLVTAVELTALGMAGRRWLGRLDDHWLTPLWKSSLLAGGVAAASVLASESEELAAIGIVWALVLLLAGVARQQRLELFFGVVGVYASGLTLVLGQYESSLGAIVGTLVFGLLIVAGAIVWRRRIRPAAGGR